jgi:hypothetical protein
MKLLKVLINQKSNQQKKNLRNQPERRARKKKNPKKKKKRKRMMVMIHMPSQSLHHAAAVNAYAPMNSLMNLHAVDASQLNAVPFLLESLPSLLLPSFSPGTSSFS